jgi:hypothetical protein
VVQDVAAFISAVARKAVDKNGVSIIGKKGAQVHEDEASKVQCSGHGRLVNRITGHHKVLDQSPLSVIYIATNCCSPLTMVISSCLHCVYTHVFLTCLGCYNETYFSQ